MSLLANETTINHASADIPCYCGAVSKDVNYPTGSITCPACQSTLSIKWQLIVSTEIIYPSDMYQWGTYVRTLTRRFNNTDKIDLRLWVEGIRLMIQETPDEYMESYPDLFYPAPLIADIRQGTDPLAAAWRYIALEDNPALFSTLFFQYPDLFIKAHKLMWQN